jgi:hypothetical protein
MDLPPPLALSRIFRYGTRPRSAAIRAGVENLWFRFILVVVLVRDFAGNFEDENEIEIKEDEGGRKPALLRLTRSTDNFVNAKSNSRACPARLRSREKFPGPDQNQIE